MTDDTNESLLVERVRAGDSRALADLFTHYRPRLRGLVRIRMHPRLHGRLDASDILQEAWLDVTRRFEQWVDSQEMPIFLWIRFLTAQKLDEMHRRHLGAKKRDAQREVRLNAGPEASSVSIAQHLAASITSPSLGAARDELREKLVAALQGMDEIDREVLTLRHFEELTNNEVAGVLGITKAGASNRYVRALSRLRAILDGGAEEGA